MQPVSPASVYNPVDDICVITSYFNPCNYKTLRVNYSLFRNSMEASGLKLFTVECAFGDAPFELDSADNIFQVRTSSVLWQKERLLNIALEHLRKSFSKIAWIDSDLLFASPNWAVDASAMLEDYPFVQLYDRLIQLPKGATAYDGVIGVIDEGFVFSVGGDPSRLQEHPCRHGRSGGAWCARSDMLEHGIFDGCFLGNGDHVMAHAMLGDWSSKSIDNIFFYDKKTRAYFDQWAARFYDTMQGAISFLPETILHLWHGKMENRLYSERAEKLARFGVDPLVDLRLNSDLCWEWNTQRPMLHDYVAKYFEKRNDDDED